jgi:ribose 5-phosphate isomerase A
MPIADETVWQYKPGVPIEVVPFAYGQVLRKLQSDQFGCPNAKLRMAVAKAGPVVSDNGNFVIDAPFTPEQLADPQSVRNCVHSCPVPGTSSN